MVEGNGSPEAPKPAQDALGSTNGHKSHQALAPIKKPAKTKAGYVLVDPITNDFVKGGPPGPGRPKGKRDFFAELIRDLERVEGAEKKSFLRHRWQRAFKNDSVAADMMSYLLPKPKPADHTEPPELSFTGPAHVNVIQHAEITFTGNGNA